MVFDAHCDTLSRLVFENMSFEDTKLHINKHNINPGAVIFACFVPSDCDNKFSGCLKMIRRFCSENFCLAVDFNTMTDIIKDGKTASFLSVEGADFITDISDLEILYNLGIRFMNLTWNFDNQIAGGVLGGKHGVTPFGKKVIKKMNSLGIIVDVSHLSEKSYWEVSEISTASVIASHSNSKSICNHKRNITDEQFIDIKKNKGMIGINFCPDFLTNEKNATVKDVILHIEHFLSLGGEDCIGIGSDFDGIDTVPENLDNASKFVVLQEELLRLNYSYELTNKILYKNFMIFVKNNL